MCPWGHLLPLDPQFLPCDHAKRLNFFNWILQNIHDGIIDPHLIFFSDEACPFTWAFLNSEWQIWSTDKPNFIHETPLHGEKIRVWCAVNAYRVTRPIFYEMCMCRFRMTGARAQINQILYPKLPYMMRRSEFGTQWMHKDTGMTYSQHSLNS